jgi:hypothetical protein
VRYALTENPTAPVSVVPKARTDRRPALPRQERSQGMLFDFAGEQAAYAAKIWEQPR